ncbi:hypothetical protein BH09CHL1_BH09CHL1_12310 [soil metagenome]
MNSEDENANWDCTISAANGIASDAPEYTSARMAQFRTQYALEVPILMKIVPSGHDQGCSRL